MPRTYVKKYTDFTESDAVERRGKQRPYDIKNYVDITCPHCNEVCAEIPEGLVNSNKASRCLEHLRVCTEYDGEVKSTHEKKRKVCTPVQGDQLVTIYKIVYTPENRTVYTGRTKNPARRMKQHASASSRTRLPPASFLDFFSLV